MNCQTHDETVVRRDLRELSNFSEPQIEEIENLISVFDTAISKKIQNNYNVNSAYQKYFYSAADSQFDMIIEDLSRPQNIHRFRLAIRGLRSQNIFDDFWIIRSIYSPFESDTIFELNINPHGRYIEVLKKLGDQSEILKDYYHNLLIFGEISPGMNAQLLKLQFQEIDFSNNTYRLVWAVHYTTLLTQTNETVFMELNPA